MFALGVKPAYQHTGVAARFSAPAGFTPGHTRTVRAVSEISRPFVRDDRVHIECVSTQVVTEWLCTRLRPWPWRASRRRPGFEVFPLSLKLADAVITQLRAAATEVRETIDQARRN